MNSANHENQSKRVICSACIRPLNACICHCVIPVNSDVEVFILQHPSEQSHAKGSARLLHLCLANSRLIIGDCYDEAVLKEALFSHGKTPVLLYPNDAVKHVDTSYRNEGNFTLKNINQIRLVIVDATWRMSRQMLRNNSLLLNLPRFELEDIPASQYRIRHAEKSDQLSSLEACTYALMQLEKNEEPFIPLLQAFDAFVEKQIQFGALNLHRK